MYHIISVQLNDSNDRALFLVTDSERTFWNKWLGQSKTMQIAHSFRSLLLRIQENGWRWAVDTGKMRVLDGNLCLAEIKSFSGVWRVVCYYSQERTAQIVLLDAFRGHQGSDRIPPGSIEKYKKLAFEAERLLKKENND